LRFVLDTNVVSALLLENSTPRRAFDRALDLGKILLSFPVLAELNEVWSRKQFRLYVDEDDARRFLAVLVRMDAKEDRREIEVAATGGVVGGKAGIRAESIVPTAATPLGSNQFQLTASTRISRGEYIVYVVGSADTMKGIHGKGYDFTVD